MNYEVKNWIKKVVVISCLSLFGLGLSAHSAIAKFPTEQENESESRTYGGGGGHDVPTPFSTAKQKYELADGEIYNLTGRFVVLPSLEGTSNHLVPFFYVSLDETPIISSERRARFPFYQLENCSVDWEKNKRFSLVSLFFKAHGRIVRGKSGLEYIITLQCLN